MRHISFQGKRRKKKRRRSENSTLIDALNSKKIEWKRLDDKKASLVNVKLEADMKDKADWPRQMEWMYNTMMELHKIVKPYYGTIRGIK